jgi:protein SCO1/2
MFSFIFLFSSLAFSIGGVGPLEGSAKSGLRNEKPPYMDKIGIDEKLGESVDLGLKFKNENNELVSLAGIAKEKPIFLMLVYYECPTLCSTHLNSIFPTITNLDLSAGKDYEFVAISIDPNENAKLALDKKEAFKKQYGISNNFHFLTGSEKNIKKIAHQVGFKYAWDANMNQWAHSAAAYVITPKGKISYYHYGLQVLPKVLRLSLVEASNNKIGNIVDRIVLFCLQYDPSKKTYSFYAYNIMKVAAALTVLILGFFMFKFWSGQRRNI